MVVAGNFEVGDNWGSANCILAPLPDVKTGARIRFAKTTVPGGVNQNFAVSGTNGLSQVTINSTTGLSDYQELTDVKVDTTFTEQGVAGWRGQRLVCVAETSNGGVVRGSTVYSNLTPGTAGASYTSVAPANTFVAGNDYTCTFTNDRTRINFAKVTRPANANQSFTVTGTNGIGQVMINAAGQRATHEMAMPRQRGTAASVMVVAAATFATG
ncbi:hypothetical protein [Chelativorans sp. J32]|uniref:prealbumin-like fold domain-containing protein n=1 Tax=Chelativorans sp. J32 TaxID=935840 RepID=UPI0012EC9BA7|nr:hypothetical protein [Chelativorans sp. J32]